MRLDLITHHWNDSKISQALFNKSRNIGHFRKCGCMFSCVIFITNISKAILRLWNRLSVIVYLVSSFHLIWKKLTKTAEMIRACTKKVSSKLSDNLYTTVTKLQVSTMPNTLVAVCQMTSTSDKNKNFKAVSSLVAQAKQRNACIAFLPEACDYIAENKADAVAMAEPLDGSTVQRYKELAQRENIWLSLGGVHEAMPGGDKTQNAHIIINNEGELVSTYRKIHLFDMENKDTGVRLMESDYVFKGCEIVKPISSPVGKIGLSICYDMRFPELSICLRNMGAQILTFPSAFTYQTGAAHWEVLLRARAIETQCYVIAAAQVGNHNKKRVSWGHAMIVDPWGTVIAQCMEKQGVAIAEIDLDIVDKVRKNMPNEHHRRTDLYPAMLPLN